MGRRTKHGMYGTPEYGVWRHMLARCRNPRTKNYPKYGGRGITVCEPWSKSFAAFFDDLGPRPTAKHVLDRKDNDGPYAPENCRWTTRKASTNNRRVTIMVNFEGQTKPLGEWVEELGLPYDLVWHRIAKLKWTPARAFSPTKQRKDKTITFNGETLTMPRWAAKLGIRYPTLRKRLESGWPLARALTAPLSGR